MKNFDYCKDCQRKIYQGTWEYGSSQCSLCREEEIRQTMDDYQPEDDE